MNLTIGILLLSIFACLSIFSWYNAKKSNWDVAIIAIVLLGLILRIFVSSDPFLHAWDERYHALVAKNLIDDPLKPKLYSNPVLEYDYKNWSGNHIWLHKQPVPLWNMMLGIKLFGNTAFAARVPSIIMSTLLILFIFLIGKELFDPWIGYVAGYLCSIHGFILELTGGRVATDHIDLNFVFYISLSILAILFYHKSRRFGWNLLGSCALGFAILSKWLPALIVLPIWILVAKGRKIPIRKIVLPFVIFCVVSILIVLPWQIYISTTWPLESAWEFGYNRLHVFEALGSEKGGWFYHINKIRIGYGELIYLPILWLIYQMLKSPKNLNYLILGIWIFTPLMFFSFVKTKMPGYTILSAPGFFLITALSFDWLQNLKIDNQMFSRFVKLIAWLLILLPIRYSIERIKPFKVSDPKFEIVKSEFEKYPKNSIIFNEEFPIEAMFYSECEAAYGSIPSAMEIDSLKKEGYEIIIKK